MIKNPINTKIIHRMEEEIGKSFGPAVWHKITVGLNFNPDMNEKELSTCMAEIFSRFNQYANINQIQHTFLNVRHGLTPEDFKDYIHIFNQYKNIDRFAAHIQKDYFSQLKEHAEQDTFFHGQKITQEVLDYLTSNEEAFLGKRIDNIIYITSIPFRTHEYLHTQNLREKQYHFCHCQFARESILTDNPVPPAICHCSMGYCIMPWETVLNRKLPARVLESVLMGDSQCRFAIELPQDIMASYT